MLSWLQHRWTGLGLLLMGLGALMLFMYGFFPIKYHTGHIASMQDMPVFIDSVSIDGQEVYNPGENSVVLMVIDGLRYDFVTEEYMPFTTQLMKNKSACIYVSVAEPPTVTMPRIKSPERKMERAQWRRTINFWRNIFAMMTGSVSTFADVALNFGAPAVTGDSVLRVAASRSRHTVMYGDDTWLRLFPGLWSESDGTTSFYVTDYTEVDINVTRHLDNILTPKEEKKPNFDFLVLHYLGLDHIGHLEGARSPKIKPKLREMDDVVKKIFTAMNKWSKRGVLFICGDHGMKDAGGHGGATAAEVLVPLVVASSEQFSCPHENSHGGTVAQVDLAPTIAWLLNSPIPGDSTGRLLPGLLPADIRQQLYLLHYVAKHNAQALTTQMGDVAMDKEFYKQYQRAEKQFAQYLATGQASAAKIAKEFYEESLEVMSKHLTESAVEFDMFAIFTAILLLYMLLAALIFVSLHSIQNENQRKYSGTHHGKRTKAGAIVAFTFITICIIFVMTLACAITETKSCLCTLNPIWPLAIVAIATCFSITFFIAKTAIEYSSDLRVLKELNSIDYLLIFGTLMHPWSFFGTSFIEEEHMTWYFYWNTLMIFILIRTLMVVVRYFSKKVIGATEVQEKPELEKKMSNVGIGILPQWVLLIALHRYLRTMNQTGDRWLFLPDTADWLNAPENAHFLQAHLVIGTLITLGICLWNVQYCNNIIQMHSAFTLVSTGCILCYRIASGALPPFMGIEEWDTVLIVNVFWGIFIAQIVFEVLTYAGTFTSCIQPYQSPNCEKKLINNMFVYNKPKQKTEDFVFDPDVSEPWNLNDVKLNFVRSMSHLVFNDMMLIIILLMRPHNVVMVPGVYFTCMLTTKCLKHDLMDSRRNKNNEVLDVLSMTLAHLWIGFVFFFYQGNSNSLASVDLGSGYVGLREYCPFRVATRMGIHAYAGPALAGCALYCRLTLQQDNTWDKYLQSVWRATNIFASQRLYSIVIYTLVATMFRHHLYVWTVFSPKLLYDFVGLIFTIQALCTIAELIIITHVTSWLAKMCTFKKM